VGHDVDDHVGRPAGAVDGPDAVAAVDGGDRAVLAGGTGRHRDHEVLTRSGLQSLELGGGEAEPAQVGREFLGPDDDERPSMGTREGTVVERLRQWELGQVGHVVLLLDPKDNDVS
jgi:hypothetical protein